MQFGDGNKLAITDTQTIQDMVSLIKSIEVQGVRKAESNGVGYLYVLHLRDGNQTYRLDSNLTFDGQNYEPINDNTSKDKAQKLRDLVLKLGRDEIPGLLPGK